ncbi:MAG: 1-acyl-sn-glycerol-3-phosphate acyltransferase [Clostridia bacterium]|nr:1-acyl-sn-glycerol-3-phosphate acyltransferase [Clostridia bacterium]
MDKNKLVKKPNNFFYFMFLMINEFLCMSARIKVVIKNKELINKYQKYILICNHRSKFDSMIIANEFQDVKMCFVSKPENFKIPIVGSIIHKCGYSPIDREDNRSALKTIIKVSDFVKNNDVWYGVFPEGTRNKEAKGLLDFKSGCLKISQKTHCPICVMTIKDTNKISKNFPFKSTTVTLEIVEIVDSSIFEKYSTVEVGNMLREKMLNSLKD